MDPLGPIAQRFPLVPRPRPACGPLAARVGLIADLADAAVAAGNPITASAVFNRAALLASDTGLPDLAHAWCREHALLYLRAAPLTGRLARSALEPLVNLARLLTRQGNGADAHRLLTDLYGAIAEKVPLTVMDGFSLPGSLIRDDERAEVLRWLWSVLLADGPRALISAGRWQDAYVHLRNLRGVGRRLLDGLQISVLAALVDDDPATAHARLASCTPNEPWEQVVSTALACLCNSDADRREGLVSGYAALAPSRDQAVFHTRLTLTVIDLLTPLAPTKAGQIAETLAGQIQEWKDGYAARDVLRHSQSPPLNWPNGALRKIVAEAALDSGELPRDQRQALEAALALSRNVITRSVSG